MKDWHKHGLALVLLAALNLGLWGRLYSPLDHAFPDGEAASAAITRFISENPNPWGWNPTWHGGQPTQLTALPAFHYAAALVAKLGNEPAYAHRMVAVTLALAAPLAIYGMVTAMGAPWLFGLFCGVGLTVLSPLRLITVGPISFLPARLIYLEQAGDASFLAGLSLVPVAIALIWRAARDHSPVVLLLAVITMAAIILTSGQATLVLMIVLGMLELTMLGIAGEYRFSHRQVFFASTWAYLLACFWVTPATYANLMGWPQPIIVPRLLAGAVLVRLLFLSRRKPLLCLLSLSLFAFGFVSYSTSEWAMLLVLELVLLLVVFAAVWWCVGQQRWSYRFGGLVVVVLLAVTCINIPVVYSWSRFRPFGYDWTGGVRTERLRLTTAKATKREFQKWRGDWGMRPPSRSDEFKITRWLVEHPPRGRILVETSTHLSLALRLNAWVPFAQSSQNGFANNPTAPESLGTEYVVEASSAGREFPVAYRVGGTTVYRVPFLSLAETDKGVSLDTNWLTASHSQIAGDFAAGESVTLKVNFHPAWRATQAGLSVPITQGRLGFMHLAPTGSGPIDLEFNGTPEQHIFGYVSGFAWLASFAYVVIGRRRG